MEDNQILRPLALDKSHFFQKSLKTCAHFNRELSFTIFSVKFV